MPTPAIMSVSASTTTYVSAAASATAADAAERRARRCVPAGCVTGASGLGDRDGLAVLVERQGVGRRRAGTEERPRDSDLAQLLRVGETVGRRVGPAAVADQEEVGDGLARHGALDRGEHLGALAHLLAH